MKPTIHDTGTVISLEGDNAIVRMKRDGSCRKCGAAAIGLCTAGQQHTLTVLNTVQARVGDQVKIGLAQGVQYQGYLLAFVIPPAALVLGMVGGYFLGAYAGFPALDVISGFASMIVASSFSLRRLKQLDATHSIEVVSVLAEPWGTGSWGANEGGLSRVRPVNL